MLTSQLLGADGEMTPMFEFLATTTGLLGEADPGAAIRGFIASTYEGELRDRLIDLLSHVTTDDFDRSSFVAEARAGREAAADVDRSPEADAERQVRAQRSLTVAGMAYFLNMNIHCNEEYQLERYEDGVNVADDLDFPWFADLDAIEDQSETCDGWPVAVAPIEIKNPVRSDVPTLILQGAYDTRTPLFMGRRASRELENSTLIIVPQQGHEVWTAATSCAGRIASAFVNVPDVDPDLACLDQRRPQWALPGTAAD